MAVVPTTAARDSCPSGILAIFPLHKTSLGRSETWWFNYISRQINVSQYMAPEQEGHQVEALTNQATF